MSKTIDQYASAVAAGKISDINSVLSSNVKLLTPGTNDAAEGKEKIAMQLSVVSKAVSNFACVRIYVGTDGWHTILFQGEVDDTPVQFIDQVHINEDGLINHIDIFMRPAGMALVLQNKIMAKQTKV